MTVSNNPARDQSSAEARQAVGVTLASAFARVVHIDPLRVAEAAASLHRPVHDEDGLADLLHRAGG